MTRAIFVLSMEKIGLLTKVINNKLKAVNWFYHTKKSIGNEVYQDIKTRLSSERIFKFKFDMIQGVLEFRSSRKQSFGRV